MRLPGGEALEARVGLHTGIAVDGLVGRGNTLHYRHATLLHLFSAVATLCHLLWGSAVKPFSHLHQRFMCPQQHLRLHGQGTFQTETCLMRRHAGRSYNGCLAQQAGLHRIHGDISADVGRDTQCG